MIVMNLWLYCGLLPMCGLAALPVQEAPKLAVRTQDGLSLSLRPEGTLAGVTLDERALPLLSETGGFHVTEFLPPKGVRREWGIVRGEVVEQSGGLELRVQWAEAGLDFQARFQGRAGCVEVEGEVAERQGQDRALLIAFRLPLQAAGWWWGDSMEGARRVAVKEAYDLDARLGHHNDTRVSRLPFSALTAHDSPPADHPVGLSLAVPLHEPRVFRLFYDEYGYQVSFQIGLAPAVDSAKGRAKFRFVLYRHDPVWGFRSAAQRYYELFPELYTKRVEREGGCGFFLHGQDVVVPHLEDFAAVFAGVGQITLTPAQAAIVKKHGIYTFKHREPWAWWHRVHFAENKDQRVPSRLAGPGDPPQPAWEEELAIIEQKKLEPPEVLDGNDQIPGPVREVAAAAQHCFIYDEDNRPRRLLWHLWWTREGMAWHSQIPLNANPRLPSPNRADLARKYQFQNMATWDDLNALHVNGVSFDSLTTWTGFRWEDYRRENFKYATIPLTCCPRNGRVVQIKGFHDWEMVKAWGEEIRAKGRFLMANTDTQPYLFCGPYLDVMGVERSPDVVSEDEMALVRTLCYQKPAFYYRRVTEKGMRKCLFYGIYPNVGVATPEEAEAARPLYGKYAPLIQKIATAGWQPITHAHIQSRDGKGAVKSEGEQTKGESNPSSLILDPSFLRIERWGDKDRGPYFTLRNTGEAPTTAEVVIDLAALGLKGEPNLRAEEVLERREVVQRSEGDVLKVTIPIGSGETLVLTLKSPS